MKGTTHLAAGLALAGVLQQNNPEIIVSVGVALGAVLPDIDKKTSLVGRYIPVLPRLIPHRSVTHSLLFAAAAYFLNVYLAIGVILHLALDMCNPEGVPLFWPIKKRLRFPIIWHVTRSGGIVDNFLGGIFGSAAIAAYFSILFM